MRLPQVHIHTLRYRYADYLYGVLVRNTEHLSVARPSGSQAAPSNGAGKRSLSATHAGGKKGAGKESKRQAHDADARHARDIAQVPRCTHAHICFMTKQLHHTSIIADQMLAVALTWTLPHDLDICNDPSSMLS